jgi:hypothetical protein
VAGLGCAEDLHNAVRQAPATSVLPDQGTLRWGSNGEVQQMGYAHYQHSIDGQAGDSVASTFARVNGRDTVELVPGNPGSRTGVEQAIRDGLIQRRTAGGYEDVNSAQVNKAAAPVRGEEQQQQTEPQSRFDATKDAAFADLIAPLQQHAFDSAQAGMIAWLANGTGSPESMVASFASNSGLEPQQAAEVLSQAWDYYAAPVARELASLGIDEGRFDEALADAAQRSPDKVQDALQRLMYARDLSGFRELGIAWKVANPPDLSAFTAAGFQTHIDRESGDVFVKHGAGQWRRAADVMSGGTDGAKPRAR